MKTEISKIYSKILSKSELVNWIDKNFGNFILTEKPSKCLERKFPCFCFERNSKCLFIDFYSKLIEISEYFELNDFLSKELLELQRVNTNLEESKIWLEKNLNVGLRNLHFYSSFGYPNIKMNFINGKHNDEFDYIKIQVDGAEFKSVYDFIRIFSKLFFEDKLLPNQYAKWKYENDI